MVCGGRRTKQTHEFVEQKWDYINLSDFKASGCGAGFAYGWLWFSLALSCSVYAVDSFTAYQLIVFDRWSSKIQPGIPFKVSKWIFSVCIILSFLNLIYEGIRAFRVMKRENVAECFMDNLAVKWESIRLGKGQGWKRFLVFGALTKSKKGAEYIALFTYFGFKSWIRVGLCSGPRQVVNAFALKAVYEAQLSVQDKNAGQSIAAFFQNIKSLAEQDYTQAVILSGMAFTFVIWAFSALVLLLSVCFYVFFLFHWIPRADGGLSGYCERKVNKALLKIVTKTVNKALAKQEEREAKAARRNGEKSALDRTATLPVLADANDSFPAKPTLQRQETGTTLPRYETRPSTPSNIEMTSIAPKRPPPPLRSGTMGSTSSSRQPLIAAAADMGYGRPASPSPSLPEPYIPQVRTVSPNPRAREPTLPYMDAVDSHPGLPEPTLPIVDSHPALPEPTLPNVDSYPALPEPTLPNMDLAPLSPSGRPGTSHSQSRGNRPPPDYSRGLTNIQNQSEPPPFVASPTVAELPVELPAGLSFPGQQGRSASTRPTQGGPGYPRGEYDELRTDQGGYSQYGQDEYGRSTPTPGPPQAQYPGYKPYDAPHRSATAPPMNSYPSDQAPSRQQTPVGQPSAGRRPVQPPVRSGTDQPRPRGPPQPLQRNLTGSMQPPAPAPTPAPATSRAPSRTPANDYYQRSQTPQSVRAPPHNNTNNNYYYGDPGTPRHQGSSGYGYGDDVESQREYYY